MNEIKVRFREKGREKQQTENRWWEVEKGGGGIMGHARVHEPLENGTIMMRNQGILTKSKCKCVISLSLCDIMMRYKKKSIICSSANEKAYQEV